MNKNNKFKLKSVLKKELAYRLLDTGAEFLENTDMSMYSSMKTGGVAEMMIFPRNQEELVSIASAFAACGIKGFHVVGGGTNILFRDDKICCPVISFKKFDQGIGIAGGNGGAVTVKAGSGAALSRVLNYAIKNSLGDCEFFFGIPGTIGGAVRMNAGSKESVMGNIVEGIEIVTYGGKMHTIGRDRLKFSYREMSIIGSIEEYFISSIYLSLRGSSKDEIMENIGVFKKRKSMQPLGDRSLGCIFKNPSGDSAGRIIEEIGFKGFCSGDAAVSEKHANFIINRGGARPSDVISIIKAIQEKAMQAMGIALSTEIKIV